MNPTTTLANLRAVIATRPHMQHTNRDGNDHQAEEMAAAARGDYDSERDRDMLAARADDREQRWMGGAA